MTHYYLDKDNKAIPCSAEESYKYLNRNSRVVKQTKLEDGGLLSTVFLAVTVRDSEPPQLFETMLFPSTESISDEAKRYSTYEAALAGHDEWLKELTIDN